jgi:hypothetical protein
MGLFRIKTGLLGNERKTPFSTSANTKTGYHKYGNGGENIENGTGRYGKNSVRFHPYFYLFPSFPPSKLPMRKREKRMRAGMMHSTGFFIEPGTQCIELGPIFAFNVWNQPRTAHCGCSKLHRQLFEIRI